MKNLLYTFIALLLVSCGSSTELPTRPAWIEDPAAGVDPVLYLVGVGSGDDEQEARQYAIREIAYYFSVGIDASSRSQQAYKEVNTNKETDISSVNSYYEDLVLQSQQDLSMVETDAVYRENGRVYTRVTLDKMAYSIYLTESINNMLASVKSDLDAAERDPYLGLVNLGRLKATVKKLNEKSSQLSVLEMNTSGDEVSNINGQVKALDQSLSVYVANYEPKAGSDKNLSIVHSTFEQTFAQLFDLRVTSDMESASIRVNPSFELSASDKMGGDTLVRLTYEIIFESPKTNVSAKSISGTAKGAGVSESEAYRQAAVVVAKEVVKKLNAN